MGLTNGLSETIIKWVQFGFPEKQESRLDQISERKDDLQLWTVALVTTTRKQKTDESAYLYGIQADQELFKVPFLSGDCGAGMTALSHSIIKERKILT